MLMIWQSDWSILFSKTTSSKQRSTYITYFLNSQLDRDVCENMTGSVVNLGLISVEMSKHRKSIYNHQPSSPKVAIIVANSLGLIPRPVLCHFWQNVKTNHTREACSGIAKLRHTGARAITPREVCD